MPKQSVKVEYERDRLLGIANKFIHLLSISSSLSRSYSTFPLCSGENFNCNSCIYSNTTFTHTLIRCDDCLDHLDITSPNIVSNSSKFGFSKKNNFINERFFIENRRKNRFIWMSYRVGHSVRLLDFSTAIYTQTA
jgi:hypothetical protein